MSTDPTKIPPIVFLNTLHGNPSAQFPKFFREAKQKAYHLMQEHVGYSGGLMFYVITLAEYNMIPQVTVGGVLQPPTLPIYPAALGAAATAADLEEFRQAAFMSVKHFSVLEAFKAAVLVAMGEDLVQEIADPLAGEAVTMELLDIFNHLRATYGVLTSADVRDLKEQLQVPIMGDDMQTFIKFSANFSMIILRLESAGQGLPAFEQMELFSKATETEPNMTRGIEKYVDNNPVLAARTLPLMIAAVRTSLSNVSKTSTTSGFSALARSNRPEMIEDIVHKVFSAKFAEIDAKFAAAAQQKQSPSPAGGGGARQPRQFVKAYCYFHGACNHPGSQCKIMLADRASFSNAKLKAKTPTEILGGSTKG